MQLVRTSLSSISKFRQLQCRLLSKQFSSFGVIHHKVNGKLPRDSPSRVLYVRQPRLRISSDLSSVQSNRGHDIEHVALRYTKYRGTRPNLWSTDENARADYADVEVVVSDARPLKPTTGDYGFQLVEHRSELKREDFNFTSESVVARYYQEVEEAVRKVFPDASDVDVFHHLVRQSVPVPVQEKERTDQAEKQPGPTGSQIIGAQPPATTAHADFTPFSALKLFEQRTQQGVKRGRFMIINTWRNISDNCPILNDHLCLCDGRTIKAPDDLVVADAGGEAVDTEIFVLEPGRYASHRWYYFPRMVKDEILVFKLYDSDCDSASRFIFHSSFREPNVPNFERESIECRCIVYFPDHEPNTIPRDFSSKEVEDLVGYAVEKVLESIMLAQYFPVIARLSIGVALYRENGPTQILKYFLNALVKKRMYGLEKASKQQLDEIFERCISGGLFEKTAKANFQKVELVDAVVPIVMAHIESPANWSQDNKDQIKAVLGKDKGRENATKRVIAEALKESFLEVSEEERQSMASRLMKDVGFQAKLEAMLLN